MFVDKLAGSLAPQQEREGVEPGNNPLELHSLDQEDRCRSLGPPDRVQELIL